MPELPEVETIRRALREGGRDAPSVAGRRILAVRLFWDRTLATPSPAEFAARLPGQVIEEVGRRGKFLLLHLTNDTLLLHLRMSGDLWVEPSGAPPAPHHRLVLDLEGGLRLAFNDTRKFGRAWLVSDPQSVLAPLGPEPFDPDFTAAELHRRLQARRRQLKPLLLDQTFIAGLGNIYVDEALHVARLHPLAIASQLNEEQAGRLWAAIRQVLEEGIRRQGASIDWVYRGGDFQNYFRVYGRAGQPCPVCGAPVQRILVGQRGTHFCPVCQQLTAAGGPRTAENAHPGLS
jgi:formamidopyrimidine-DNA glycosylase